MENTEKEIRKIYDSMPKIPVGYIIPKPISTLPHGWIDCDGSSISKNDFPELFKLLSENGKQSRGIIGWLKRKFGIGRIKIPDLRNARFDVTPLFNIRTDHIIKAKQIDR